MQRTAASLNLYNIKLYNVLEVVVRSMKLDTKFSDIDSQSKRNIPLAYLIPWNYCLDFRFLLSAATLDQICTPYHKILIIYIIVNIF